VTDNMPESTIRLLATTDWWCGMLDSTCERMSHDVGRERHRSLLNSMTDEELVGWFSEDDIYEGRWAWLLWSESWITSPKAGSLERLHDSYSAARSRLSGRTRSSSTLLNPGISTSCRFPTSQVRSPRLDT
jgi:hypothetical protein